MAGAEPVTLQRIEALPEVEKASWKEYLERSEAAAHGDEAALKAELIAIGLTKAVRAPDGGDFKLSAKPGDAWYAGEEAGKLADIVLSFQAPSGGWSKHTGYRFGPRRPGMQWSSQYEPGRSPHYLCTFDNRSTTEQLQFLANMWEATKREDCKAGFVKGLDFILAAQYPNGGWPQVYPLEGKYHDAITFNDDAMTHVLELVQAIGKNEPRFAFLTEAERTKAADALSAGIRCVLQAQVAQNGKKTAWCAQHDPITLEPTGARDFEPATLSGLESSRVLKFLMTVSPASPELVESIESGLTWLERVKITGMTNAKRDGRTVYEPNAASTEVYWARFYDLETSKPVFPGRNGILYSTFEEMAAKNDLGYDFYTTLPGSILSNGQKKWRKMLEKEKSL
jgi:PelA/Pel-15E family pectate lyase